MLDMPNIRDTLRAEYDLAPNPDLAANMQDEYARMARVVSPADWAIHAPYVAAINALKRKRNATILAHNYMTPEIYHGIGDVVGDSLQLAIAATQTDADVIVQCGVHFMAETSKNPEPRQDSADARHASWLFAGGIDHARGHCRNARALSRCAGRDLCQHHSRCEGSKRYMLHIRKRGADHPRVGCRHHHHDARSILGAECRRAGA